LQCREGIEGFMSKQLFKKILCTIGEREEDFYLLPENLWAFLYNLHDVNSTDSKRRAAAISDLLSDFYADSGQKINVSIPPVFIRDLSMDFCKGIMYAAKHFQETPEKSEIHRISGLGFSPVIGDFKTALGICIREDQNVEIAIFPALMSQYFSQIVTGRQKIYDDYKIPSKLFDSTEVAFLTGLEEAVHAQQMLIGRYVKEYEPFESKIEGYENAICEKEAEQIQRKAVAALGLGVDDIDTTSELGAKRSDAAARRSPKKT